MSSKNKEETNEDITWTELAKRVVMTSIGSAAMARKAVTNGQARKEMIGGILNLAEKRKEEFLHVLAKEVSSFLGKVNVSEELIKALQGLVINLNASIDFKENKNRTKSPRVVIKKAKVTKHS